ncbi:MAG: protease complex subunit PrcB family protein [Armatimonadota bacterium]
MRAAAIGLGLCLAAGALAAETSGVRTLRRGSQSAVEKPLRESAATREQYVKLWNRQFRRGPNTEPPPAPPAVDFSREMVLAAFAGQKNTAGYTIEITGAREEKGKLVVTVVETTPPPGAIAAQILTYPYHYVAVKKSALPITWKTVARTARPRR